MTSFNLNYFLEAPSPNTVIIGVRASIYKFGETGEHKHLIHKR